jgi:hypothetical protein
MGHPELSTEKLISFHHEFLLEKKTLKRCSTQVLHHNSIVVCVKMGGTKSANDNIRFWILEFQIFRPPMTPQRQDNIKTSRKFHQCAKWCQVTSRCISARDACNLMRFSNMTQKNSHGTQKKRLILLRPFLVCGDVKASHLGQLFGVIRNRTNPEQL